MRLCSKRSIFLLGLCSLFSVSTVSAQAAPQCPGDADGSGVVDSNDMVMVLNAFGARGKAFKANIGADQLPDGFINGADLAVVLAALGQRCSTCPNDFNNDGAVDGADLGNLLATGTVTGTQMVTLLNDWGPCKEYVSPTKRNAKKVAGIMQKSGQPTKADISKAKSLVSIAGLVD